MEFSGINLLSLIFCARLPELIRMVVRSCASHYLTSHRKRQGIVEVTSTTSFPCHSHASFVFSLPTKWEMLLVNASTEFSISHRWLIECDLMKRRQDTACEIPKPCNQAALRARVLPTQVQGSDLFLPQTPRAAIAPLPQLKLWPPIPSSRIPFLKLMKEKYSCLPHISP